jgi:tetratricopeptide (TPR) repeat protein
MRRLHKDADAEAYLKATRELDPLDSWSRYLTEGVIPQDGQQRLDLGLDLLRCHLLEDALVVLSVRSAAANDGSSTMLLYALARVLALLGQDEESRKTYEQAAESDPAYIFPSRLEEILLLEAAIDRNPRDPRAPYYLGNLLYDKRRHDEAIQFWERAAQLDLKFPTTWRNLGFAYFNVRHDAK